jgi:sugar O-acyltransferase (sialic acid O-acetyltransferase NeuD family)
MTQTIHPQATDAPLIIIGGGGHTRVLIDVLQGMNAQIEGIVTQEEVLVGQSILGVPVLAVERDFKSDPARVLLINGVGNRARGNGSGLKVREGIHQRFAQLGYRFASIISPRAIVSAHAELEEAVQILHGAIVQAGAKIHAHAILNTAAVAEHDCTIGAYSHMAPAATLCGGVHIGKYVHVGANATVVQQLAVGDNAVIGAGIRVARNVAPGEVLAR